MDAKGNGLLCTKNKTEIETGLNQTKIRFMCILSGCDYLKNIGGKGLLNAKKIVKTMKSDEISEVKKN